jgi:hypothetical protein
MAEKMSFNNFPECVIDEQAINLLHMP